VPVVSVAAPSIIVFDSGVGGLTVAAEIARIRPDARLTYIADDAGFPYGRLDEAELVARVIRVLERILALHQPDLVVIACNTASTLALPHLRARFPMPFVGTVPAIKPAVLASSSRRITVLATPGTVARDYTHELIRAYAGDCEVTLVGSRLMAAYAEAELRGEPAADDAILAELLPCFIDDGERRTDTIALACTHYPLLKTRFDTIAPWHVAWIDPGPAIGRRVNELLGPRLVGDSPKGRAIFTSGQGVTASLRAALANRGFPDIDIEPISLD
jgi:glutamate racemase